VLESASLTMTSGRRYRRKRIKGSRTNITMLKMYIECWVKTTNDVPKTTAIISVVA